MTKGLTAANDAYEDEMLAHLAILLPQLRGKLGMLMTGPMSDGRRWILMPLDNYQADLERRQSRGAKTMQKRAAQISEMHDLRGDIAKAIRALDPHHT